MMNTVGMKMINKILQNIHVFGRHIMKCDGVIGTTIRTTLHLPLVVIVKPVSLRNGTGNEVVLRGKRMECFSTQFVPSVTGINSFFAKTHTHLQ